MNFTTLIPRLLRFLTGPSELVSALHFRLLLGIDQVGVFGSDMKISSIFILSDKVGQTETTQTTGKKRKGKKGFNGGRG